MNNAEKIVKPEVKEKNDIILRGRSELTVGGVEEVINFDEEGVRLKSVDGEMIIEGNDIKIGTLDTDRGVVSMRGRINGIYFASDPDKQKKGLFGKIMR